MEWRVESYFDDRITFISKATTIEGSTAEWLEAINCLLDCRNYKAKRLMVVFRPEGVELSSPKNRCDSDDVFFVPAKDLDGFIQVLEAAILLEVEG